MNLSLEGRKAFVTGGGRGIGAACSLCFAEAGADVTLTYRRDLEAAEKTVAGIQELGRKAWAVKCEVSNEDQVAAAIKQAIAHMGAVDILVANAGVASRGNAVHDTSTEEMRRVLDTHVMGSFWCCREVLDSMRAQGTGHIILISSAATMSHGANGAPYNMAKSAMESLMKTLHKEEGPYGIRVNVIAPGLIETEMGRRLVKATQGVAIEDLHPTQPFGRVGQPEDIGNLAAFLCSEAGSYINGQVTYVYGGSFVPRQPAE